MKYAFAYMKIRANIELNNLLYLQTTLGEGLVNQKILVF
jgi:hypothetical protein